MKNNLIVKKYAVQYDNGTKNMSTVKSFFGTKLIDIEDNITIDNTSIKYKDYNGYQNYNEHLSLSETEKIINQTTLKETYHTMSLQTQDMFNIENNTRWIMYIDIRNILRDYLFGKIKERRTFKTIKAENTKEHDINLAIYKFIDINVLNRYELSGIDMYLKYYPLKTSNIFNKTKTQYNPIFDELLYDSNNLITDYSLIKKDQFENLTPVKVLYNQTKKSTEYKFDYYFNLNYKKI